MRVIQDIIDYLVGTCYTIDQALDDDTTEEELTEEELNEINNQIFNCSYCGMWYRKQSDESEVDGVCLDCNLAD